MGFSYFCLFRSNSLLIGHSLSGSVFGWLFWLMVVLASWCAQCVAFLLGRVSHFPNQVGEATEVSYLPFMQTD